MPSKEDNMVEQIKKECMELFSSANIFNNCGTDLISKYKKLFKVPNVKKVLENEELITTVRTFFDNNLNISVASKEGFMHRNTLVYRLDKLQNMIGLDVRNFNEAVVFENLILFYNMIKDSVY